MINIFNKKIQLIIIIIVFLSSFNISLAEVMSSGSYQMELDSVNFGGAQSSSASYLLEDTFGESGTGELSGTNYNASIGYQQASIVPVTPSTPTTTTPSTTGGSISGGTSFIPNVKNFTATPLQKSILLTWEYPELNVIDSVVIIRSDKFFPSNLTDGEIIFQGNANKVFDYDVEIGKTYYYALFARNSIGIYSSGVLARARIIPVGEEPEVTPPEISTDPFADLPQALNVDPIISALTLLDFDFIQDGRKIEHTGNSVPIDANKNLTVQLQYNKVPEILKTIAITLRDPEDTSKVFTFLLRANKEKTVYEATISSLERSGNYQLNAVIVDYKNQSLKRLAGDLRALSIGSITSLYNIYKDPRILFAVILLFILAFIAIILFVNHNRNKRDRNRNNNIAIGLIFLIISGFAFTSHYAFAAFNKEINYQGKLADSAGDAVADSTYAMEFNLYTVPTGGTAIWTETLSGLDEVTVTDGLFSVMLGSVTSLSSIDFDQTLYLGINIEGDGEMSPRKKLGAVPAAFVADTLDGLDSTQFLRSDTGSATSGYFIATTTTASVFPYASTTAFTVSGALYNTSLLNGCLNVTGGLIDSTGSACGGAGADSVLTRNALKGLIYAPTTTDSFVLGGTATTTDSRLQVFGTTTSTIFVANSATTASVFPYASSTALTSTSLFATNFTLGTLDGPLQANNGLVSATTSIGVIYGGTGLTSIASSSLLIGGPNNTFIGFATSSLGIALGDTTGTLSVSRGGTGQTSFGQGWLHSDGTTLTSSTSPTVAYITATSTTASTFPYASTTALTVSGTPYFTGISSGGLAVDDNGKVYNFSTSTWTFASSTLLGDTNIWSGTNTYGTSNILITGGSNGQVLNTDGSGNLSWIDQSAGSLFAWTPATNYGANTNSTTTALWIQNNLFASSSIYASSDIWAGNTVTASYFTATSTTASIFPYASTTALSADTICISTTCRTTWPAGSDLVADWNQQMNYGVLALTSTTTIPVWFKDQIFASSSAIFAGNVTANTFIATGTTASVFPYASSTALTADSLFATNFTLGTLNGPLHANNGIIGATTSIGVMYGGTGQSSFGQGWLHSDGSTITSSTSPTVAYITATSTTQASTFPYASTTALSTDNLWATGSVGIGSTTPWAQLAVSGIAGSPGFAVGSSTGTQFIVDQNGNVGIGTADPGAYKLNVSGSILADGNIVLNYSLITNSITAQNSSNDLYIDAGSGSSDVVIGYYAGGRTTFTSEGNVGIGTTSPYAKLSVVGPVVAEYFHATSTTATSTFAGGLNVGNGSLVYDFSTGITSIDSLTTGNLEFDTDAGMVTWTDLLLESAPEGTPQGYTASLNGSTTIMVYGLSAGNGNLMNDYPRISIGSSTPPSSKLTIFGNGTGTEGTFEVVNSASSTLFKILNNGIFTASTTDSNNATSTINGNLYVNGTFRATNSYAGDLIFANNFTFTEAPLSASSTQGLLLRNQKSEDVMTIDEKGNISLAGDVCYQGNQCFGKDINSLSEYVDILASSTAELLFTSRNSTEASLGELTASMKNTNLAIVGLNDRINNLSSTTIDLINENTLNLFASTTILDSIASTTADAIASSTPILSKIFSSFMDFLSSAMTSIKGIFVKELHIEEKLCVDDICINKEQLKSLLISAGGISASSTPTSSTTTTPSITDPAPVSIPIVSDPAPVSSPATTTPISDPIATSTPSAPTIPASEPTPSPEPVLAPELAPDPITETPVPTTTSDPVLEPAPVEPALAPEESIPEPAPAPAPEPAPAPAPESAPTP